jgi:hypothetical protein
VHPENVPPIVEACAVAANELLTDVLVPSFETFLVSLFHSVHMRGEVESFHKDPRY